MYMYKKKNTTPRGTCTDRTHVDRSITKSKNALEKLSVNVDKNLVIQS